jgi:hypothetical protein
MKTKNVSTYMPIALLCLVVVGILVVISLFGREAYCSTKAQFTVGKNSDGVPATEADIKQVPNLGLKVGQKIGSAFSEELKCERELKPFIFF